MKLIFLYFTFFSLFACNDNSSYEKHNYYTWEGLEPDRWSSIWLLKRHIDLTAEISVLPAGAQLRDSIAIVTPNAAVIRTHGFSNFENLIKAHNKTSDAILIRIGKIINELEISPWRSPTPETSIVEQRFRELQVKYNRVDVPYECYAGFFDILYDTLKNNNISSSDDYLNVMHTQLAPENVCNTPAASIAKNSAAPVPEYPVDYVLKMINANKVVVFVDTREDEEFDEHHIPGAVNLKLREVDVSSAKQFEHADLIISYCIKDFRGYEVALALSKVGVKNIGIMKPYGLKGWKDLGLPVANSEVSDEAAIDLLKKMVASGV